MICYQEYYLYLSKYSNNYIQSRAGSPIQDQPKPQEKIKDPIRLKPHINLISFC